MGKDRLFEFAESPRGSGGVDAVSGWHHCLVAHLPVITICDFQASLITSPIKLIFDCCSRKKCSFTFIRLVLRSRAHNVVFNSFGKINFFVIRRSVEVITHLRTHLKRRKINKLIADGSIMRAARSHSDRIRPFWRPQNQRLLDVRLPGCTG
ncbi:hypothetical protein GE061_005188 [Apolygus lucorum]|uniref:Uncharacterized protein n=1 Tax=Apolygus lucorum TaxID=248454 RepID=A0A8S9WVM6_APOLU|nr:hypothetical protein GE061_005188 [Apolygus lucorum]